MGTENQASTTARSELPNLTGLPITLFDVAPGSLVASGDSDDDYDVVVEILSSGGRGDATFAVSVDGGATYGDAHTLAANGVYTATEAGSLLVLTFADEDFTEGHLYSFAVTKHVFSAVTKSALATGTIVPTGTPAADYTVIIEITTTGVRGAGAYRFSLNNGSTYSAPATIPANGVAVLGASGITATFAAASYTDDDTHSFTATAPTFAAALLEAFSEDTITDGPLTKTLQVLGTFTGNVDLEGSLDESHWVSLGQLTAAGKIANSEAWKHVRAHISALAMGSDLVAIFSY